MLLLLLLAFPLFIIAWLYYFDKMILAKKFARVSSSGTLPERIPGPSVFVWLMETFFVREPKLQINLAQRKEFEKYGKEVGMYLIPIPMAPAVTICSPELVRKVFSNSKLFPKMAVQKGSVLHLFQGEHNIVFNNGEDWKRQRMLMNPTFTNIDRFAPVFVEKTQQCLDIMYETLQNKECNKPIPTLDILGECVFDYDFETMHNQSNKENLFPFLNQLPTQKSKALHNAVRKLDELIYGLIEQAQNKKKSGVQGNALLDVLLEAATLHSEDPNASLSQIELRDNIVIFFVAGSETTANALSCELYFLAKYPEIQEKLYKEIIQTIGEDGIPTAAQCRDFVHLNMFINESLRYFHPAGQVAPKVASEDTELGGYKIPKGTMLFMGLHTTHHHPIWEDPDVFRPERFAAGAKRPSNAYFPFGGGNRICIGNTFSILEQQLFLSLCLQKYKISLKDPNYEIQLDANGGTMQPDSSLQIILTKIN